MQLCLLAATILGQEHKFERLRWDCCDCRLLVPLLQPLQAEEGALERRVVFGRREGGGAKKRAGPAGERREAAASIKKEAAVAAQRGGGGGGGDADVPQRVW